MSQLQLTFSLQHPLSLFLSLAHSLTHWTHVTQVNEQQDMQNTVSKKKKKNPMAVIHPLT